MSKITIDKVFALYHVKDKQRREVLPKGIPVSARAARCLLGDTTFIAGIGNIRYTAPAFVPVYNRLRRLVTCKG